MILLGTGLAIPMSLLASFAPSDGVLFVARVGGASRREWRHPTTLALITALWSGPPRTKAIGLGCLGGALVALSAGRGALLEQLTGDPSSS
jgi:hypothetical protein